MLVVWGWDVFGARRCGREGEELTPSCYSRCYMCGKEKFTLTVLFNSCCVWIVPQGRHVKTGQLAAIKIMEVTEVRKGPVREGVPRRDLHRIFFNLQLPYK